MKILNRSYLILTILFLFSTGKNFAQEDELDNFSFSTYGTLRAHLATFSGQGEIQDASPRVGFFINYYLGRHNQFRIYSGGEFAINLIDNQVNFQADPNVNNGGFSALHFLENKSTFSTRLGYVGIDFAKYGNITIGKQNSLYKDIADKTDIFNVMSGQASYVYSPTGADGGETGTGRAESAFIYSNQIGKIVFGFQSQFRANANTFFDSFATYLNFRVSKYFSVGAAYNKVFPRTDYFNLTSIQDLDGDPEYITFNAIYNTGKLYIAAVYASQKNGDFVNVINDEEEISVFYNGKGYELAAYYMLMKDRLKLMTGFNYKAPETNNPNLPKDFRKRLYLIGLQYQFVKYAALYSEYKFEDSITAKGFHSPNVFMIGLRIDFDKTWRKKLNI